MIVVGEGSGRIQLIEVKNKYILRSYGMGKNRVNALTFSNDNRHFASCANDTCIRYFDIQDSANKCAIEIQAAHSDNIKQVALLPNHQLLSGSADKHMKLWDLRNTQSPVATFKVENPIEDFCLFDDRVVVAQGNTLTLAKMDESSIRRLNDFYPFQKPCLKVKYDATKKRVIAGGLDSHLKFFSVGGSDMDQLQVDYKIKVPSEIFAFDVSKDGNHFALGLNDSSLIIKSKQKDLPTEQAPDEEAKLLAQFEPTQKQTSKSYKYFNSHPNLTLYSLI